MLRRHREALHGVKEARALTPEGKRRVGRKRGEKKPERVTPPKTFYLQLLELK